MKIHLAKQLAFTGNQCSATVRLALLYVPTFRALFIHLPPTFISFQATVQYSWLVQASAANSAEKHYRRKIFFLCRGSNPVVQSVDSHYTDWATLAPTNILVVGFFN
jgi:hypothetical protein